MNKNTKLILALVAVVVVVAGLVVTQFSGEEFKSSLLAGSLCGNGTVDNPNDECYNTDTPAVLTGATKVRENITVPYRFSFLGPEGEDAVSLIVSSDNSTKLSELQIAVGDCQYDQAKSSQTKFQLWVKSKRVCIGSFSAQFQGRGDHELSLIPSVEEMEKKTLTIQAVPLPPPKFDTKSTYGWSDNPNYKGWEAFKYDFQDLIQVLTVSEQKIRLRLTCSRNPNMYPFNQPITASLWPFTNENQSSSFEKAITEAVIPFKSGLADVTAACETTDGTYYMPNWRTLVKNGFGYSWAYRITSPFAQSICGNSIVDSNEACDDGNAEDNDGCSASCQLELPPVACTNDILNYSEQCDDGNLENGDGCNSKCMTEADEVVPPIGAGGGEGSGEILVPAVCGNGIVDGAEMCDDGNTVAGDGCSEFCFPEAN